MDDSTRLREGDRVVVLGGGPAGAFFAIHLLTLAKKTGKKINITIVDKETPGCNFCAGVISPRLQQGLQDYGIRLPDAVLCHTFSHIWIHGQWKNFPLKVPSGAHVSSVFRGTLPGKRSREIRGFDPFILACAQEMGAEIIRASAWDISYTPRGYPAVTLGPDSGKRFSLEGAFLCICTGMNAATLPDSSPVFGAFARLHPGFKPPAGRRALIFELKPGRDYLKKYMDRELYILVSGTEDLDLDHASLVPKRDCLTVSLIGKSIDRASFPEDIQRLIRAFFSLPGVRDILPGLTPENTPAVCSCTPLMAVSKARFPYGPRMALAGDAFGARLYRDGLYSAFSMTRTLAAAVLEQGVDEKALARACDRAGLWLERDNIHGRRLMGWVQRLLKSPFLSRVLYQTFATEMKFRSTEQWPVGRLLWQIGSGAGDFGSIFRTVVTGPVLRSAARGVVKTLRNIGTEIFFGLNWERYGRYPAVIIKEKRRYIKSSISKSLGITLDAAPDMERMYAVKVRAEAAVILEELGKFGMPGSRFLRLRFVDVRHIAGTANEEGSVVQYRLSFLPVAMDIRLIKRVGLRGLVYEPSPLFCRNGKLIFEICPTRDGNNRLVIYTAFDYKKGGNPLARGFWFCFRHLFPDFAHDVVWNHAICAIKAQAERAGVSLRHQ